MKYIKLKSGGYTTISVAAGVNESAEIAKVFGADVDQVFDTPPQAYLDQVAAEQAAAKVLKDNAAADAEIRRISLEALPDIIDWLARNATGADRAAMQLKLAEINAERAKKK